jgi:predicted glycoside hydrolase/deacetylase ChbG (UPF0249 family)
VSEETSARFLIVNADDFGLTNGVNRGITESHESGVVTSASLMVRYQAAEHAAEYARAHPKLSVGLHFDVQQWHWREGKWEVGYQVIDVADAGAVCGEFERQLAIFENLLGRPPTHLDSHQHIHLKEPARSIMLEYAGKRGVPLRSCTKEISYRGGFYGQTDEGRPFPEGISTDAFLDIIATLAPGWTEMSCHPGFADGLHSAYLVEREEEMRVLRREELRTALNQLDVQLRSFHDFRDAQAPPSRD